jgi:uncharacterized repeat protein (TIGR01451 family)
MKISPGAPPRATRALAVGLVALPAVLGVGHPVTAHQSPAVWAPRQPGLTVSVDDGRVAVQAGDRLTYTVTVRDTGLVAAPRLNVTQTIADGLAFISASGDGVAENGRVTWSARLPAGGTRTFQVAAKVTRTPATLTRLAAVACVELPGGSRPVACAAHLDRLPAAAPAASQPGRPGSGAATYAATGLAVLALGLYTGLAARRLARSRRPAA